MHMSLFRRTASAATTAALAICLGASAPPDALASNLLLNGEFNTLDNWTTSAPAQLLPQYPGLGEIYYSSAQQPSVKEHILTVLLMSCVAYCQPGVETTSQIVNNLVTGDHYQLTFYAAGNDNLGDGPNKTFLGYTAPGPLTVSLGDQVSSEINVPYITAGGQDFPWAKYVLDFSYAGSSSSAALSFVFHYLENNIGCTPCGGQDMAIALADLEDVSQPSPQPPQPTPEPSSLAGVALGLVVTRWVYLRQRGSMRQRRPAPA